MYDYCGVGSLVDKKIASVTGLDSSVVTFTTECGKTYRMEHQQDCCEHVSIDHVYGNADSLVGETITYANQHSEAIDEASESGTRTTFTFNTNKGVLIIVWEGYSNGYYGEGVSFYEDDGSGERW